MLIPPLSILLEDSHLRTLLAYSVRIGYETFRAGRTAQLFARGLELMQAGCQRLMLAHGLLDTEEAGEVFRRLSLYLVKRLLPTGELASIDLAIALKGPLPA